MSQTDRYPEPTVSAVIFNSDHKILLCRSTKWNNQYVIPGGHIEKGERMEDALRREVYEETGLSIYDIQLISIQESIFSTQFQDDRHFIFIDFLCKTDSSVVKLNHEADSYVWAGLDEILSYDLGGFCKEFFIEFINKSTKYSKEIYFQYATGN